MESQPRIGVYVCHCGTNIAAMVDVEQVAEFAATLPHVVVARDYLYMCSDPGQTLINVARRGRGASILTSCK
jgi:heterodisulfide reductase subunit A